MVGVLPCPPPTSLLEGQQTHQASDSAAKSAAECLCGSCYLNCNAGKLRSRVVDWNYDQ